MTTILSELEQQAQFWESLPIHIKDKLMHAIGLARRSLSRSASVMASEFNQEPFESLLIVEYLGELPKLIYNQATKRLESQHRVRLVSDDEVILFESELAEEYRQYLSVVDPRAVAVDA